ncbi:hypothetical protein, partial [Streptomyces himalayensis]|uniref:hypothetical protein n=1 Tax=Streptomyces himalayensis TaxID=2820085 RepID=UPI001C69DFB4
STEPNEMTSKTKSLPDNEKWRAVRGGSGMSRGWKIAVIVLAAGIVGWFLWPWFLYSWMRRE